MSSLLKQKGRSIRHFRNILSRTSETMGNLKKEKKNKNDLTIMIAKSSYVANISSAWES